MFVNRAGGSWDVPLVVEVSGSPDKEINAPNDRSVLKLGPFHRSMDKRECIEESIRVLSIVTQMSFEHDENHRIWSCWSMFGTEAWLKFPSRQTATEFKRSHGASKMLVNADGKELYLSVERYGL